MPLHWGTNSFGLPPSGGSWKEYRDGELVKQWKDTDYDYGIVTVEQCRAVCQQTNGCIGIKYKEFDLERRCFLLSGVCLTETLTKRGWDFYVMHKGHAGPSSCI